MLTIEEAATTSATTLSNSTTAVSSEIISGFLNSIYLLIGSLTVSIVLIVVKDVLVEGRKFTRDMRIRILEKKIENAYTPLVSEVQRLKASYEMGFETNARRRRALQVNIQRIDKIMEAWGHLVEPATRQAWYSVTANAYMSKGYEQTTSYLELVEKDFDSLRRQYHKAIGTYVA
jgi:hypothetical protein